MAVTLVPKFRQPRVYVYTLPKYKADGWIKIGMTSKPGADSISRIMQQEGIKQPEKWDPEILLDEPATVEGGAYFTDKMIHKELDKLDIECWKDPVTKKKSEWYRCEVAEVWKIIRAFRGLETPNETAGKEVFKMRREQEQAVKDTSEYFERQLQEFPDRPAKYLWNAKMRFGKTFTTYQLAKKMGWRRILILTFKPAVEKSWEEDLKRHKDFDGWQFVSRKGLKYAEADKSRPIVWFDSFQDVLQKDSATGAIKAAVKAAGEVEWDCIVCDEYHFGAWRKSSEEFIGATEMGEEGEYDEDWGDKEATTFDPDACPLKSKRYLMLSGTPFRQLRTGTFLEDQIFNWTYGDEQRAKAEWDESEGKNPYLALPKLTLMTYQMPEELQSIALNKDMAFDLNEFFRAEIVDGVAKFVHENEVDQWLDMIRGQYLPMETGAAKPLLPFKDVNFKELLLHTLWFLPNVASCKAMARLLKSNHNAFYHDYDVYCCAGNEAGIGVKALDLIENVVRHPEGVEESGVRKHVKSITLTCGKLTTGVTVKAWSGIFMLRSTNAPETYFQSAFRVQSPWVVKNLDRLYPESETIMKPECFVFDFAPQRAFTQIAEYSAKLSPKGDSPEKTVKDFINFFPIICFDGSKMRELDAAEILEYAMSGTTATLLARKWNSFLLVNVTDAVLEKIKSNPQLLAVLDKIEGFASIRKDISTIINSSNKLKRLKAKAKTSSRDKAEIDEETKKNRSRRKELQEKLVKFAVRIPIFMYLTDKREESLMDLIRETESDLFKQVTGLTVADFNLLVDASLFDSAKMNEGIFGFRCYERGSYEYLGEIAANKSVTQVGGWDFTTAKTNVFN